MKDARPRVYDAEQTLLMAFCFLGLHRPFSGRIQDVFMIIIRFPDTESKHRALGFLSGRFSIKSWASGEMAVPETALAHLATENIPFSVEGQATYERLISTVRNPAAAKVYRRPAD